MPCPTKLIDLREQAKRLLQVYGVDEDNTPKKIQMVRIIMNACLSMHLAFS